MDNRESVVTGTHGAYDWLVADRTLRDVLEACPELVVGKYLAITSFDSGPLALSESEIAERWESRDGIAYSPRISRIDGLPYDNCYDEWYVLDAPRTIGIREESCSNPFEEHDPSVVFTPVNRHFSPNHEDQQVLELFWRQLDRIRPTSYIADCTAFVTLVTSDKQAFAKARMSLGDQGSAS